MEAQLKHLLKLAVLLLGVGAAVLLTPACRAQSEVSPDHFDGTDSWAAAAQTTHPAAHKQTGANGALPAEKQKGAQASPFQLAAAQLSKPERREAVVRDRKRKTAASSPERK